MPQHKGKVLTILLEIEGQRLQALNSDPQYRFTEAISLSVDCADQAEADELWARLSEGGSEGQCAGLKDKFGVSWQVVARALVTMLTDPDGDRAARMMQAMVKMQKIDIARLHQAYHGQ
jgi:predicted 3-demethylubiquinone-9 3-methyltransferase (glyoxalase superfamily)